jgi:DNA-binding MarR family transcriptional regulator
MHAVTFQLKRAHLCAVTMGRRLFEGTPEKRNREDFDGVADMTPARFDILYVVWRARALSQREICRRLGLHRSTISEGIARLVELGLVECNRLRSDRRVKPVQLTDEGLRRLKLALHLLFTKRPLSRHIRAYAATYDDGPRRGRASRVTRWLGQMWQRLIHLAKHFGNSAALVHQLSPADTPLTSGGAVRVASAA